jgi:hypothetical protein
MNREKIINAAIKYAKKREHVFDKITFTNSIQLLEVRKLTNTTLYFFRINGMAYTLNHQELFEE